MFLSFFTLTPLFEIFKSLQNYWNRVTCITSFDKYLEFFKSYSTLSFCSDLVSYRFKNMFLKEPLTRWFCLQTYEGQRRSKVHLVGIERTTSKYHQVVIKVTIGLLFCPSTVWYSVALWLTRRCILLVYDGLCLKLFREAKVMIFIRSDW